MNQFRKLVSFAQQFDQFAAPYEFEIESHKRRHTTLAGFIFTLLTFVATLFYLNYRLYQWKNLKLQPVITRNRIIDQSQYIDLLQLNLTFSLKFTLGNIDVLKDTFYIRLVSEQLKKDIYFQQEIIQDEISSYLFFYLDKKQQYLLFIMIRDIQDYQISISQNTQRDQAIKIELTLCNSSNYCSDPSSIQKFIDKGLKLRGRYNISSYDHTQDKIVGYNLDVITQISAEQAIFFFSTILIQNTYIDYGYPFQSKKSSNKFISEGRVYESRLDRSQSNFIISQEKVFVRAYISLSPVIEIVEVQHMSVLDIIIMVFSLQKLLHSIGLMVLQKRSKILLERFVYKKSQSLNDRSPINDSQNQSKRTDIFFIFEQINHIENLLKYYENLDCQIKLLRTEITRQKDQSQNNDAFSYSSNKKEKEHFYRLNNDINNKEKEPLKYASYFYMGFDDDNDKKIDEKLFMIT